jgi:hypothetical protein
MRNFINILNESMMDPYAGIQEAYKILQLILLSGEWQTPDQYNEPLNKLMTLIPRPDEPMTLYRVLRLTDEQKAEYEAGTLVLHNRLFSSWTKKMSSANSLARVRGANTIIVKHKFPPANIVVDVREFYEDYDFTDYFQHAEYSMYAKPENEVLVHDSGTMPINQKNSKLFVPKVVNRVPKPGDMVRYEGGGNDYDETVLSVDADQPWLSRGLYKVKLDYGMDDDHDGEDIAIRNVGPRKWEMTEFAPEN